jgi:8-oxo-dGTP diphosphatase
MKRVVAGILLRDDRILICQRREDQPFSLEWEFPGGKIEPGEEPAAALARELDEELGIGAAVGPEIACVRHAYASGLTVELQFFEVTSFAGEIENRIFREIRWEERASLQPESFLEADRDIVRQLKDGRLLPKRGLQHD